MKYFIGIEVAYSKGRIFISQRKYVLDLFKVTGKLGSKSANIPTEQNHILKEKERSSDVDKES